MGHMWEHFVLNEMMARLQSREINYWRDKSGHEVDFVLAGRRKAPIAIECKWASDKFESRGLQAFRRQYPEGENYVIAADVERAFTRKYGAIKVRFENLEQFVSSLI